MSTEGDKEEDGEEVEWSTSEPEKTSKGLTTLQDSTDNGRELEEDEEGG